ncbi:retrovirus-related pol polyprotein from transposon RE1 [Citrus sinensis]|nr:retrovirus-related pol polyprotein from transposon RE1 [Citrus sinensis]
MSTSNITSSSFIKEPSLNIQSFHQCSSLVSIKLDNTNFLLWRSQVLPLVRSLGILHHITDAERPAKEILLSDGEKAGNEDFTMWINNDGLLTSWLLSLMTEEVMSGIVGVENAQQIWSSLEDQLLPMTKEKEVHLMDRLATLKKGSLSVEEYVRKYKHICDCLAAINKPVNDLDKVFGLARGLGYRYQDFKLAQLSKPPYPSFKQFVMALENHEQTLINFEEEKKNTINLAQAFFSQRGKGKGRGNGGFFNSKGRGFTAAGGQNLADSSGQKINYNGGKSWNNNASQSWQKSNNNPSQQGQQSWQGNSGQQWQQPRQNNSGQPWQKIQNQSKQQAEEVNEETVISAMNLDANDAKLYADSGATTHMVNDPGKISELKPYEGNDAIVVGNGDCLNISHIGNTSIDTGISKLYLKNVLVVPGLKNNLLSVEQLTHDNSCIIEFSSNKFVVKDYQGNILAKGTKTKGLYALDEGHHVALYLSEGRKAPYNIWHQRMGHPQIKSIKFLNKNKLIDVSNWITKDYVCSSCQMGKNCKLPFNFSNKISSVPLHKIHCDLWGPAPISSVQNFRYYAVFVDDCTRYTWLYPLKNKSDLFDVFIKFQKQVENRFDKRIKIFQSDGGGEFISNEFQSHLSQCGIQHQLSCPATPEQNGVAERKHRHIVETGLTMLFHANMPLQYWVDAFSTAVYVINKLPSSTLNMKTPFYKLFGINFDYRGLRSFGCRCFPYLRIYRKNKFSPKTYPCVFIGYSPSHKGYRCLYPPTNKVYISRHVIFDENLFPFKTNSLPSLPIQVSQEIVTFPDVESWTKKEKATNKPYHTHRCHDILSLDENSSPFQQAQHEFHVNQQQVAHANPNSIGLQNTMNSNMHDLDTSQQVPREIHDIVIHTDSASTDNQASLSPSSASFEEFDITLIEQDLENNIGTGSTHLELETNTPQSTKGIDIFVDLRIPKEPETSNTHQMITRHKLRHHPELVDKMALTTTIEPKHFKTAIRQPHWRTAMLEELDALHQNNTWSLVPRPVNTNIVGSKWVYRTKFKEDGSIDKYKARLVAQGYTQIPGLDFEETFSPVIKPTTIRLIFSLAVTLNWTMRQLDVKNAFLHGFLKETIFMEQPPGFSNPLYPDYVCKLNKSLYGLKQAPRAWFDRLSHYLLQLGFICSKADSSLFIFHNNDSLILMLIYVDDIVVIGNNTFLIDQLIHQLSIEFALKDLGQLHFFLGLEIRYFSGGIYVSQTKYTKDLLTKAKMLESTSLSTPMAIKEQANPIDHKPVNATEYRRLVGGLQYLTLTRPDIVHAVNKVCQHFQTPTEANLRAVKRILRYLKGSLDYGIRFLQQSSLNITAFCDADWGGCPDTRRSTTGYCVYMGANCISWSSKRQPTVSRSSAEAEYRALASTAAELTWITYLYREIGIPLAQPPQILSDNLSALYMTINPVFHARSKHIELDYHFIREKVADGALVTRFVPYSLQIADVFTKALSKAMFRDFRYKLGVHQMSLASLRGDVKQVNQDYQKESHQRSSQQRVYHSTQLAHVKAICQGISPARFLHLNANIM